MDKQSHLPKAMRLPTTELDGYRLVSGVVSNEKWPKTFPIPPEWLRRRLRKGHSAKLVFDIRLPKQRQLFGERMWVDIEGRDGPYYVGTLLNEPVCYGAQRNLKRGQKVVFLPEHIVDLLRLPAHIARTAEAYEFGTWLVQRELKQYLAECRRLKVDPVKRACRRWRREWRRERSRCRSRTRCRYL